jgi:hypothetical protein
VGADRIARTAHAALRLLAAIRERTGYPIPLAWIPAFDGPVAAIEVYPAATLKATGIRASGYKKPRNKAERREIVRVIRGRIHVSEDVAEVLCGNADVLDAAICSLAGLDFIRGKAFTPEDWDEAVREGWIWVVDNTRI